MRKFLLVLMFLFPGAVRADLPAHALQILCEGDKDVCLLVVSEITTGLFTGLREASNSTATVRNEARDVADDVIAAAGFRAALGAKSQRCMKPILPAGIVSDILAADKFVIEVSGISSAEWILALIRQKNRDSCKTFSS